MLRWPVNQWNRLWIVLIAVGPTVIMLHCIAAISTMDCPIDASSKTWLLVIDFAQRFEPLAHRIWPPNIVWPDVPEHAQCLASMFWHIAAFDLKVNAFTAVVGLFLWQIMPDWPWPKNSPTYSTPSIVGLCIVFFGYKYFERGFLNHSSTGADSFMFPFFQTKLHLLLHSFAAAIFCILFVVFESLLMRLLFDRSSS